MNLYQVLMFVIMLAAVGACVITISKLKTLNSELEQMLDSVKQHNLFMKNLFNKADK